MRIVTWNINGISTILQYHPWSEHKSFKLLLDALDADIICLQEIKCRRSKITNEFALVEGYDAYFSFSRVKHGYSGVAVYVRQPFKPISAEEGITGHGTNHSSFEPSSAVATDASVLDAEGRCVILEFDLFVLFCIYFPNDASEERRMYKMDYHRCVQERTEQFLQQGKQVVIAGDINAMHKEIDCCDPKNNMKEWGITDFQDIPGRRWLDQFLSPKGPMVDLARFYHPTRKGMFTCWNTKIDARASNYGTRIDYILASKGLEPWFKYSDIQPKFRGSDHCPVYADFHDTIEQNGPDGIAHSVHIRNHLSSETVNDLSSIAAKNFDEYSNKQKKLSSFFTAKRPANDDDEDLGFTLDSKDGSSVSQSPSSSNVESPVDSQITVVPSVKPSLATATTVLGKKRKKSTSAKPNQPSLSTFFSLGGSKKSSTSPMSQDSKPSTPADMGTTQTADPNSKEDEFVDVELLIKQHEQTVKAGTQWNALFKPRSAPMCNVHKETCKEFVVNKKGVNHGRRFYLCSRPVGPQGQPNSIEYRCDFFMWQTEFDKKRSSR